MVFNFVTLSGLVFYIGQKHYRRVTAMKGARARAHQISKPYSQPKAGLDAEENWKTELEAKDIRLELESGERYEIEGDVASAEMAGFNRANGATPPLMERYELSGEEQARELHG